MIAAASTGLAFTVAHLGATIARKTLKLDHTCTWRDCRHFLLWTPVVVGLSWGLSHPISKYDESKIVISSFKFAVGIQKL